MKFTVTNKVDRAILDSLFAMYTKCEACGKPVPHSDNWYDVDIIVDQGFGIIEMPCPECGHVHMETIRFDGIKTLEAAWARMKNEMNTNAIQSAAAKMNVNRGPATNVQNRKPRNIQEAAQMRLMKKKGGR